MKIKIWVLSTVNVDELSPALPRVYGTEAEAEAAFDEAMRGEWEAEKPEDDDGNPLPYPGNPRQAHDYLSNKDRGDTWGLWELTPHHVEIGGDILQHVVTLGRAAASYCDDIDSGFRDGTYDDPEIPAQVEAIEAALAALAIPNVEQPASAQAAAIDPWEEDDRFPRSDWRLDVANGDTNLGYAEWLIHQRESAAHDLTDEAIERARILANAPKEDDPDWKTVGKSWGPGANG